MKRFHSSSAFALTSLLVIGFSTVTATTALTAQEPLPIAAVDRDEPVHYVREILPILKRNCLACHFEQESEGGLNIETHQQLLAGGDSGSGIVPGALEESWVWLRASGHEEPLMPPEDNSVGAKSLTPEELGLLRLWIEQGAAGGDLDSGGIDWQPVPESVHPVYAVAVSPDGKWLARGRGNQVAVFDVASGEPLGMLVDPSLPESLNREAADIDLVQSVAFSPLGDQIATGGFRTVKLWHKVHRQLDSEQSPLAQAAGLVASDGSGKTWAWVNAIGDLEVTNGDAANGDAANEGIANGASDRPTQLLPARGRFPVGLALSTAGDRVVVGDADGILTVWRLSDSEPWLTIDADRSLRDIAVDGDGRTVAALTAERTVMLWQIKDDVAERLEIPALTSFCDVVAIAFVSEPSLQIAVGTEEGRVELIELESGEQLRVVEHGAAIEAIAVDRDGMRMATAGRDGVTRLWNLADGSAMEALEGDPEDGLLIATADRDHARQAALLTRLDAQTAEIETAIAQEQEAVDKVRTARDQAATQVAETEEKRQAAEAKATAIDAEIDEAKQAAKKARQRIEELKQAIADAEKGIAESEAAIKDADQQQEQLTKQRDEAQKSLTAAVDSKRDSEAELTQRQKTLDTATEAHRRVAARLPEHQSRLRDETRRTDRLQQRVRQTQARATEPGRLVTGIAFSPEGDRIGTRHRDGSARIYRAGETSAAWILRPDSAAPVATPRGIHFGPQQTCCLFDESSPASVWTLRPEWHLAHTIGSLDDSPISDRATAIDFRPDGLTIAVGSGPPSRFGEVKLFSTHNGRMLRDFGAIHSDTVFGLRFSPDGTFLASSAADKTIRLLDVSTGSVIRSLEGHTHHVLALAWHDNSETIASAGADQTVKVWNVDTGGQRRTLTGFPKEVTAIRFVAQSGQIVSACADGQVRLHNSDDGKLIRSLNVSPDFLFALAVTPDGTTLVAGGQTGTVQVWNLADGKLLHEIR